ncbi:Ppx/GppA family phosphatase [Bacillus sp. V5-8f]|uniref:Ppx/GppA family phosphatase n=1 Tax=Bacillus sp. V5-8f TaxID=2053044 RepID=UPI000C757810|nr:Ppx/GppA family phosphatase [Bacillus sp. V5-8f]PLT32157.1 Ppx/GppA family phosphatase [Bacillus sp. V5-8f]
MEKKIAIVDIGSNTIRLVIYRYKQGSVIKQMENMKVTARLQNHLDEELTLTPEGMRILLDSLKVFKQVVSLHKVTSVKLFATAAIRQAKNQEEIKRSISAQTGFSIEVLSGEEEAYYGFLGIINSTYLQDGITIDIGGGSTEITKFVNRRIVNSHSFSFGALSLKKRFIKEKVPTSEEIRELSSFLKNKFQEVEWLSDCQLPIIGIGGNARNLGAVNQALKNYPLDSIHNYEMYKNDILTVKEKLSSLPFQELIGLEGLSKERADIIIPAIEVFLSLYRTVDAPFFQLSQKGIRDGVLYDELSGSRKETSILHPLNESLKGMAIEYDIDTEKRALTIKTAEMVFNSISQTDQADFTKDDLFRLMRAGSLYNLGEFIESESVGQHTFYILLNRNIDGLSHRGRIILALLASYHSKASFKRNIRPFKDWFSEREREKLKILGSILKLSFVLNRTKRDIIQKVRISETFSGLDLALYCNNSWLVEQQEAEKHLKHLENSLGKNINLHFILMK